MARPRPRKRKQTRKETWVDEYHGKMGIDRDLLRGVYETYIQKKKKMTA